MLSAVALLMFGCGGTTQVKAPNACDKGKKILRAKVGPEMDSVVLAEPTPVSQEGELAGCALVYVQHSEETPEELPPEEVTVGGVGDQRLAFALYGNNNKVAVSVIDPAPEGPGSVMMSLSTRDVTGDGRPEIIVQEDSASPGTTSYRGLRIFSTAPGQPKPRDLFSQRLLVKTPEGLEIVPTWKTGQVEGRRAIFFDGAGTWKIFTWNGDAKVFVFDEEATKAKNPKPEPAKPKADPTATPSASEGAPEVGGDKKKPGGLDLNLP